VCIHCTLSEEQTLPPHKQDDHVAALFSPDPPFFTGPELEDGIEVEITKAYAEGYLTRVTTVVVLAAIRATRRNSKREDEWKEVMDRARFRLR
jgi:hypothetical protein